MLALIISFIISILISGTCIASEVKSGSIAYGILGFIASQVLISLLVRKKIKAVNAALQDMLAAGQKRLNYKINQFKSKPGGNPNVIQRQVEKDQQELFKSALGFTEKLEPFKKWNLLMAKQISTMRLQFLYQLKEFKQVDEIFAKGLLSGPILSDPMLVAMKMARQHTNEDATGAEKTFKRYIKWFRNDNGALLYGLMSWIYVKQNQAEDARQLLAKAKEKMYNDVISRNWEVLSNNRIKNFSNAGFGDQWYSLYL
ncbi:MAG: hypothetical protein OES84_05890, partial [Kiritimatiellaceae bacterium]|nr:hypothetical protein [Kiritimatiellaceae bacterium]